MSSIIGDSALSAFSVAVKNAFDSEGSDKTLNQQNSRHGHSYQDTYAKQFMRLYARHVDGLPVRVAEVGVLNGASLRAMRRVIPFAEIFGFDMKRYRGHYAGAIVTIADAYAPATWSCMPRDFDLIIDDGSHKLVDILRGLQLFLDHLRPGGVLLIEDIQSEEDVAAIMERLPGSELVDTRSSGRYDDLVVLYAKPIDDFQCDDDESDVAR